MDSIYASPDDFKKLNHKNKIKGLHLLEYFVNRCHEIGVLKNSLKCSVYVTRSHPRWCNRLFKLQCLIGGSLVIVMFSVGSL